MKNMVRAGVVMVLASSLQIQCGAKRITIKNQTTAPIEYVVRSVGCAKILRGKTLACSMQKVGPHESKEILLSWITTGKAEVVVFIEDQQFRTGMTVGDGTTLLWPESFGNQASAWVAKKQLIPLNPEKPQPVQQSVSTPSPASPPLNPSAPIHLDSHATLQIIVDNNRLTVRHL